MTDICHKYLEEIESIKKHKGYRYLGELILSEDELQKLFAFLSKADLNAPNNIACLTVAAVNCAFYYYDEKGFWEHFDRLIMNYSPQNHTYYGRKILRFLKGNGFISSAESEIASDEYQRYVRPIVLQSGISKKHVPRFAEFLKRLIASSGLATAITISSTEFKEMVSTIPEGSVWLRKILFSEAGWEYTKDVLRHLDSGHSLEELCTAKGFHNELWERLLNDIEEPAINKIFSKYKKPYLAFIEWKIGISFDSKGAYNNVFTMNGRTVRNFEPIGEDEPIEKRYSGKMHVGRVSSEWTLEIWCPQEDKWALFHADFPHKYVRNRASVLPGRYYLIHTEEFALDGAELSRMETVDEGDIEILTEDGYLNLKVYNLDLQPDMQIDSLGLKTAAHEDIKLEWINGGQKLGGVIDDIEVWIEDIMPLKIAYSPSLKDRVVFYQNVGLDKKKIDLEKLSDNALHVDVALGIKGKIWAKPFGRSRISDETWEAAEKNFCRLPKCELRWPKGLYSHNEKPEISFISDEPIDVIWTYPGNIADLSTPKGKRWQLPSGYERVEGLLRYKELEIGLAHPIYQCKMTPEVIWQDNLRARFDIRLHLLPQTKFSLSLAHCNHNLPIIESKTNGNREVTLSLDDIKDAVRKYPYVAGRFIIECEGQTKDTGALFINTDLLINAWETGDANKMTERFPDLPSLVQDLCRLITSIRLNENIPVMKDDFLKDLPPKIKNWIVRYLTASSIFDGHSCFEEYQSSLNEEWLGFASWARKCRALLSGSAEYNLFLCKTTFEEGRQYENLMTELPVDRWNEELKSWLSKLDLRSNIKNILQEWQSVIINGTLDEWGCEISRMVGGKEVTKAWYYYSKNKPNEVCRHLNSPEVSARIENGNSIVKSLTSIVQMLSLLRSGQKDVESQIKLDSLWQGAIDPLEILSALYAGKPFDNNIELLPQQEALLLQCPLTENDKKLVRIITDYLSGAFNETEWLDLAAWDWFSGWILYNLAEKKGLDIQGNLIKVLKAAIIPPPIKFLIDEKLRRL